MYFDRKWKGESLIKNRTSPALNVARLGLLFALAICLSFLEGLLPPLLPIPGIKLGLSNVVIMYAVYALGAGRAFTLAALKALFVMAVRGTVAAVLSLSGGMLSVAAMWTLLTLFRGKTSYAAVSMAGAAAHNVGQLLAASGLLRLGAVFWYYLLVLLASGIVMGLLTAALLRAVMPCLVGKGRSRQNP